MDWKISGVWSCESSPPRLITSTVRKINYSSPRKVTSATSVSDDQAPINNVDLDRLSAARSLVGRLYESQEHLPLHPQAPPTDHIELRPLPIACSKTSFSHTSIKTYTVTELILTCVGSLDTVGSVEELVTVENGWTFRCARH